MHTKQQKTAQKAADRVIIPKNPIRFIFSVSKPHKWFAIGALMAMLSAEFFLSVSPFVLKKLVDELTAFKSLEEGLQVFFVWGIVYVLLQLFSSMSWSASGFTGMQWLSRANKTAYERLYNYISLHSNAYFSDRFAGSLSNKISNASDGSERLLERTLWGWLPETIGLLIGVSIFFTVDKVIAVGYFLAVFVVGVVNFYLVKKRRPHVIAYAASSSKLRGDGVDFLTNIAASRQYVRRKHENMRISKSAQDRREKDIRQWAMSEWMLFMNRLIAVVLVGAVLGYMYVLFKKEAVGAGDIILVLAVLGNITHIITHLGNMMNGFIRMYGEIEEGLEEVLVPHEIDDKKNARKLKVTDAKVEWNAVDFGFDDNQVFDKFNLDIPSGQRVGLVGSSGAGKTTFVSLLLRQHDIDGGEILIDGQNIAKVTQDSLRENIAVVPQEPLLFHRSIRENIAYGKLDATQEEIELAAQRAQAHDFIMELPEGYDTLVGERGVKLSGGQKQRVAIARAMLKDAPILVLDEATSALDSESEVKIQKALHELMVGKTVVAIAHRLSTLREMDRIIVLEQGVVIEDGTHDELVASGGVYARLWAHQAGGFLT